MGNGAAAADGVRGGSPKGPAGPAGPAGRPWLRQPCGARRPPALLCRAGWRARHASAALSLPRPQTQPLTRPPHLSIHPPAFLAASRPAGRRQLAWPSAFSAARRRLSRRLSRRLAGRGRRVLACSRLYILVILNVLACSRQLLMCGPARGGRWRCRRRTRGGGAACPPATAAAPRCAPSCLPRRPRPPRTPPHARRRRHVAAHTSAAHVRPSPMEAPYRPTRHPTGQGPYGVSPPAAALGASSAARRAGGPAAASGAREPVGPRVSPRRSGRQSPARLLRAAVSGCCEPAAGGRVLPGLSGPHASLGPGFSGRSRVSRRAREQPPLCATCRVAGRERDRGGDGAAMSRSRLGHASRVGGWGGPGRRLLRMVPRVDTAQAPPLSRTT